MMRKNKYVPVLLVFLAFGLTACPSNNKTTGDKVGDAIDNTKDAINETGEKIADESKDAANEVKDEVNDAANN